MRLWWRYEYFKWSFGNDTVFTQNDSLIYVFRDTGWVDVSLMPGYVPVGIYERACFDTAHSQVYISDLEASFVYEKDEHCSIFLFTDSSRNGMDFQWDFGHPASQDRNSASGLQTEHDYGKDTGIFNVCLIVTNPHGCKDTVCEDIHAEYSEFASLYNIFTPNEDGLNDDFGMSMVNADKYRLLIYNRWGELVFMSDDMLERWNGTYMNSGDPLPEGEYFYVFTYRFNCSTKEYESHGMVELVR